MASGTIHLGCFWIAYFLILWMAFYADGFSIYQNISVFLAQILVMVAILGSAWAYWGMKFG